MRTEFEKSSFSYKRVLDRPLGRAFARNNSSEIYRSVAAGIRRRCGCPAELDTSNSTPGAAAHRLQETDQSYQNRHRAPRAGEGHQRGVEYVRSS